MNGMIGWATRQKIYLKRATFRVGWPVADNSWSSLRLSPLGWNATRIRHFLLIGCKAEAYPCPSPGKPFSSMVRRQHFKIWSLSQSSSASSNLVSPVLEIHLDFSWVAKTLFQHQASMEHSLATTSQIVVSSDLKLFSQWLTIYPLYVCKVFIIQTVTVSGPALTNFTKQKMCFKNKTMTS